LQSAVVAVNTLPFGPLKVPRLGEVKKVVFGFSVSFVVVEVVPERRVMNNCRVTEPPTLRVAWSEALSVPPLTELMDRLMSTCGH